MFIPVRFFGSLGHQNAIEDLGVSNEIGRLSVFFRHIDVRDDDISLAALQSRQQSCECNRLIGHLKAEAGADRLAEVDIEAKVFALILWIERSWRYFA